MAFFMGLLAMYGLMWLLQFAGLQMFQDPNLRGIYATACMFIFIGISHFAKPEKLLAMIPERWPYRRAMNYISGFAEILLGAMLLFTPTRQAGAYGLILLLITVFPANISVSRREPSTYNISRLFFQPVYILWVWWFAIANQPVA